MKRAFSLILALAFIAGFVPAASAAAVFVPGTGMGVEPFVTAQWDFDRTENFDMGLALVYKDRYTGLVRTDGTILIPPDTYQSLEIERRWHEDGAVQRIQGWLDDNGNGEAGLVDQDGRWLLPMEYSNIHLWWAYDSIFLEKNVGDSKKCGVADETGKIIIPAEYDDVEYFWGRDLWRVRKGSQSGLINTAGTVVVPVAYNWLEPMYDDLWRAARGDSFLEKLGVLNNAGNTVVPFNYDHINEWGNGLIYVEIGMNDQMNLGLFDQTGKVVLSTNEKFFWIWDDSRHNNPPGVSRIVKWSNGLNSQWLQGLITDDGELIFNAGNQINHLESFWEGRARFTTDGWFNGFINEAGEVVIPAQYYHSDRFSCGYAIVHNPDDETLWAYIDVNGEFALGGKDKYSYVNTFDGETGLAWVRERGDDNWHLIDTTGETVKVIDSDSMDIRWMGEISEGLAAFEEYDSENHCYGIGYMDINGGVVIEPMPYRHASPFYNGYAVVQTYNETDDVHLHGLIDKNGTLVVDFDNWNIANDWWHGEWIVIDKHISEIKDPVRWDGSNDLTFYGIFDKTGANPNFTEADLIYTNRWNFFHDNQYEVVEEMTKVGDDRFFKSGLIDANGKIILPAVYDGMWQHWYGDGDQQDYFYEFFISDPTGGWENMHGAFHPKHGMEKHLAAKDYTSGFWWNKEDDILWKIGKFNSVSRRWELGLFDVSAFEFVIEPAYSDIWYDYGAGLWRVERYEAVEHDDGSKEDRYYHGMFDAKTKEFILPADCDWIDYYSDGLWVAEINGRQGIVNKSGGIVLPFDYSIERWRSEDGRVMIRRLSDDKCGFIDAVTGQIVIAPQYDNARPFTEGLAGVRKDGKWGFIDPSGQTVIPFTFDNAQAFSEGLAAISGAAEKVSGDLIQVELPPVPAASINIWHKGWGTPGFTNENIAPATSYLHFRYAKQLVLELAAKPPEGAGIQFILQSPAGWWQQREFIIDDLWQDGKFIFDLTELNLGFDDDESIAKMLVGYFGYGEEESEDRVDQVWEDLGVTRAYLVTEDWTQEFGYINPTGATVIGKPEFTSVNSFSHGLAAVTTNAGTRYIDNTGTYITELYQYAGDFSEGLAWYRENGKWGLLRFGIAAPDAGKFAPGPGSYNNQVRVTFPTASSNIAMYYTINGGNPTANSTRYTGPILLDTPGTYVIRAIAVDTRTGATSAVTMATYIVTAPGNNNNNSGAATPEPTPSPSPSPEPTPAVTPELEVQTTVEDSKASAEVSAENLETAIGQFLESDNASIVITVTVAEGEDVESVEVTLPANAFQTIANDTDANLTVDTPLANITFNNNALETIAGAGEGDVMISVDAVDMAETDYSDEVKEIVGNRPVYDFNVTVDGESVHNFGLGKVKVEIPYELQPGENPNAIIVYYIKDDGSLVMMRGYYSDGTVVFVTNHFSKFFIAFRSVTFTDVASNHPNKAAIDFVAAREITTGIGDGKFSPAQSLTRAQLLVMIMKAYGYTSEEAESYAGSNFDDAVGTWYEGWIGLAKRDGITAGIGSNLFGLDRQVSREEMLLLVYKTLEAIGETLPEAEDGKKLDDFDDADEFSSWVSLDNNWDKIEAVLLAGIYTDDNLLPQDTYERAMMAQLLYNLLTK